MKILFLCTGNSCRSQMAEGWARTVGGDAVEAYSAGLEAHGLNPRAVQAMQEAGVDITGQRSDTIDTLLDLDIDLVVTVCGHAHETCPVFPRDAEILHAPFDDPPALAAGIEDDEAAMAPYRRVRDEIRQAVIDLFTERGIDCTN